MLRSTTDFERLQSDGRMRSHPSLAIRFRRNGLDRTRYGVSTGRRMGTAVVRNRVRRRLRTILRRLGADVGPGWDVLLVARPPAATVSQTELEAVLTNLMRGAGMLGEREGTTKRS